MNVIKEEGMKVPAKIWANNVEAEALLQIMEVCKLPFIKHHASFMPDCHAGMDVPIGSVIFADVLLPSFVGVDIGCGMLSVKLNRPVDDLEGIVDRIYRTIPLGFNHHKDLEVFKQFEKFLPTPSGSGGIIVLQEYQRAMASMGTLGGGNHFIEFQTDKDGKHYIMIHSGSRNLGKKVCDFYSDEALKEQKKYYSDITVPFFPEGMGENYLKEMTYCYHYAKANRKLILLQIMRLLGNKYFAFDELDISHNFASWEKYHGMYGWVHRKGAVSIGKDELGIIPGSQGTKSYIVKGLGNEDSYYSCSHGAGRAMSRTKAKNTLSLDDEKKRMEGIVNRMEASSLDEAPSAYKDITQVMEDQKDLVEIVTELTPIANIKG